MLLGNGSGNISAFGGTYARTSLSPSNASADISIDNNGGFSTSGSGGVSTIDTISADSWFFPEATGVGNNYWVRATLTGGSAPSSGSGTGTWLALSSNRSWANSQSVIGTRTSTLLLEIAADAAGTIIVNSGTIIITATKDP
jgi:hypothetical protein